MKIIGFLAGVAFGLLLAGAGLSDYNVIHNMLRLRDLEPYFFMGSAVAVAAPLLWLLSRRGHQTAFGGPLALTRGRVERRHILGSVVFGSGWALAGTCPAPALVMLGSGALLGAVVAAGLFAGLLVRETVEKQSVGSAATTQGDPVLIPV